MSKQQNNPAETLRAWLDNFHYSGNDQSYRDGVEDTKHALRNELDEGFLRPKTPVECPRCKELEKELAQAKADWKSDCKRIIESFQR